MAHIKKIVIPLVSLAVLFLIEYLGFFNGVNGYFYDLSFRLRGARTPPASIVIVAVDEKTMAELGRWPIARRHYATLLEKTKLAAAVGFDIVMAEPSPDDAGLAAAIAKQGAVVLPIVIEEDMTAVYPSRVLASARTGHVHIERGLDGIAREVYHTLYFRGKKLPSFSSVVRETAAKSPFARQELASGGGGSDAIVQSDAMTINFYGGPGAFTKISFADVAKGAYPPDTFRGKIVLVGITALGLVDSVTTPFSETRLGTAGVEVQANILANLLEGNAVGIVPLSVRFPAGALFAVLLYAFFFRTTEGKGALVLVAALGLGSLSVFLVFSLRHVWFAPAGSLAATVVLFAAAYVVKLSEAAASLGATYKAIGPHLRNRPAGTGGSTVAGGLAGIVTPRGIQAQASLLADITHELIFEKELSDRILLSDVFGVAVFDGEGRAVMASRDVRRICDVNAVPLDGRDRFAAGLSPFVLEKGGEGQPFERWLAMPSVTVSLAKPEKRFLKLDVSRLPIGETDYALFILSDITKIKEVEILKGQIVSIVSHEMKTPMFNILGFSEIMARDLDGDMGRYAAIVKEESERLTKFVNTFLDINRIEEGRQQIVRSDVDLAGLVRDVAAKMEPVARKRNIRIDVEAPEALGAVSLDRDLTAQSVLNLAENAIKYSPPGKAVTIRVAEDADAVNVEVADEGYGIREKDLERIFEKFFRSDPEAPENIKGSGLGLTFVKEATEAQGGTVGAKSAFGRGSTFTIRFPAKRSAA